MRVGDIIESGTLELGVPLPPSARHAFEAYYTLLEQRGETVNLTAITGEEEVAKMHFLDSLAVLKAADFKNTRLIDIGSGAGLPGVPIKLAEPSTNITLLDATKSRVTFISELCAALGIAAACIHARAEESSRTQEMREHFDIAVARAVARLDVLCELCVPFVRVGGLFLAMKSANFAAELDEALSVAQILGVVHTKSIKYTIPGTEIERSLVVFEKMAATPSEYPRRYAKIKKHRSSPNRRNVGEK